MYSLLTGRDHVEHSAEKDLAKSEFTAGAHRAAMRRLLLDATTPPQGVPAERLIAAAAVHAEAAKTAPASLNESIDEAPKTTAPVSRVRINARRDHDSL